MVLLKDSGSRLPATVPLLPCKCLANTGAKTLYIEPRSMGQRRKLLSCFPITPDNLLIDRGNDHGLEDSHYAQACPADTK